MAGILSDDYAALKRLHDISGAISLREAVQQGYMPSFSPKKDQLACTCTRCARRALPERNAEATASQCGHEVTFDDLSYCAACAMAKGLCRRCGVLLPPRPRKSKKKKKARRP